MTTRDPTTNIHTRQGFASFLSAHLYERFERGEYWVSTLQLAKYLEDVAAMKPGTDPAIPATTVEANNALWLDEQRHQRDSEIELGKATIEAGRNALRATFLLNGGACVALLAFMANVATAGANPDHPGPISVAALATGMLWFAGGVLLSAIVSALTYLGQRNFSHAHSYRRYSALEGYSKSFSPPEEQEAIDARIAEKSRMADGKEKWGHRINGFSIAIIVGSFLAFLLGIGHVYLMFQG